MPGVSMYPCSLHGKRVIGRLGSIYPSVVHLGARRSRKMRVCNPCLDHLFTQEGKYWIKADIEDDTDPVPLCGSCRGELGSLVEPYAFFITVYRRGQEREDWFSTYCEGCALNMIDSWSLTS